MAFIQIIEFRSSKFDEMRKVGNDWEAAAADTTARSAGSSQRTGTTRGTTSTWCSSTRTTTR